VSVRNALAADHHRDADANRPGDAELISAVRAGSVDAYAALYRRHLASARALARQLTGCPAEADDLVAEAFTRLFTTLRRGGGPDAAFRAYLLTALRHVRYDRTRQDHRVELSGDMTRYDAGVLWQDTAVEELESRLASRAFTRLPERWQIVLWRTEVEQQSPAEVAPLLGLTPNGLSALAYRAREGLRQAYLQEHVTSVDASAYASVDASADARVLDPHRGPHRHGATLDQLGAWARDGLSPRRQARMDAHLATCLDCRVLAAELADVSGGLCREPLPRTAGTGRTDAGSRRSPPTGGPQWTRVPAADSADPLTRRLPGRGAGA
jgi:RNA polymerase sigma factor (sigma-70 family)